MPVEAAADSPEIPCPVRRSGRQAKRTDKLEEFLSTAKRAARKSAPPSLEGGDPPSQTPTDAETASEASFDGSTEAKAESPERRTRSGTRKQYTRKPQRARQTRSKGEVMAKDEASSGNEEENKGEEPLKTQDETKPEAVEDSPTIPDNTNVVEPQTETVCEKEEDKNDKETDETEDEEPEKPAVLVKRGPIRTYINKKRAASKNTTNVKNSAQVNKAATKENNKTRGATTAKSQKEELEDSSSTSTTSSSDESDDGGYDPNALYCICRQKHNKRFMICCDRCEEWFHGDCVGITEARGRLMERNGEDYICPNCTVKKNQVLRPATSGLSTTSSTAEEKAADDLGIKGRIEKASNPTGKKKIKIFQPVMDKTEDAAPKCIGPGCEKNAQPDSVYCGNDCILRHAAAAMKSITEPSQKDKTKPQKSKTKVTRNDILFFVCPAPPKEDKLPEKEQKVKEVQPTPETPATVTPVKPKKSSSPPPAKISKVSPKGKKSSRESSSKVSKKPTIPPSKTNAKSKKSSSSQPPSQYPAGPIHVTGALRVTKSNFTIPKKQPQPKDSQPLSQSSSSSSKSSSSSSSSSHHHHSTSSSRHSHSSSPAPPASPMPPPPNNQMRQNIRRSLTDILYKRVSDSDDLKMTESEVGKLAYAIEREMFNLCLSTDSKYKNKYRSLMLHLKDPKNKGLFYRVIGGEVTPFRLVRLSSEELLSKEISEWRKTEVSHSKHRHESRNIDMEDAPPTSDADVCMGSVMPDIFSSMLKDTTSEHRTHLFDLNCKICTGQKKEEELLAKKEKHVKKETKPSKQEQISSRSGDVTPASQPQPYQHQEAYTYQPTPIVSYEPTNIAYEPTSVELSIQEPQLQIYQEDPNLLVPPPVAAPVTPAVSSVTITRRDPRMARHGSAGTVPFTVPDKPANNLAEPTPAAPVSAPVEPGPKVPLPMPPAPPSAVAVTKTVKSSSEPPPEGETAIFLHGQEKIWKGFMNMQNVAKFVTKAYLVSGSFEHLKEDLPDTIHIGGRISPNTELCLIRFHPATEEEEVAYVSLYSYFSSRKRFGVVANNNRRIKDLYLIPLSSKDPLPPKLLSSVSLGWVTHGPDPQT
uniref:Death inducer-obliterator 1 n=1 Tax=Periophthalmus magnuspinnatus TaxID=409849 RepID=A0A3B4BG84_9GOBI